MSTEMQNYNDTIPLNMKKYIEDFFSASDFGIIKGRENFLGYKHWRKNSNGAHYYVLYFENYEPHNFYGKVISGRDSTYHKEHGWVYPIEPHWYLYSPNKWEFY